MEIGTELKSIGQKHTLHIDEVGVLEREIQAIVSGKTKAEDFVEKLIDSLNNRDVKDILEIATDVNILIFKKMREGVIGISTANTRASENDVGVHVDREDILSAIENPAPTEHPISIAQPKPVEKTRPSSEATDVAHAFIGEKLSAPVSLPSQKVVVPPTNIVTKPKPSVDPYREAIE